jgi:(heptosyl)LPS beta-1,4-glucosyltransferase
MLPLTVTILTKNEEVLIERCINSVQWADEVLVLDSGSSDRTCQIALSLGATVYSQDWLGWSAQHQRALELARHDWILVLDADEIVTPDLARSIEKTLANDPNPRDGYAVNRRGDFFGILLPNSSSKKNKFDLVRLFNRNYGFFDPSIKVHEKVQVPGKKKLLAGDLLHWRGRNMDEYIASINSYATVEAIVLFESGVKATSMKIFVRPIMRFFWCYFFRGGIKLGARGLIHAFLAATSEYVRYTKLWEMQHREDYLHPKESIYSSPIFARDMSLSRAR